MPIAHVWTLKWLFHTLSVIARFNGSSFTVLLKCTVIDRKYTSLYVITLKSCLRFSNTYVSVYRCPLPLLQSLKQLIYSEHFCVKPTKFFE